jgi:hypothetical protein
MWEKINKVMGYKSATPMQLIKEISLGSKNKIAFKRK